MLPSSILTFISPRDGKILAVARGVDIDRPTVHIAVEKIL